MTSRPSDVAFTQSVKAEQERRGSREQYRRVEEGSGWADEVTPALAEVIAEVRSFYLATASASGQPYIQHRGGPAGFLKVIGSKTLAFADYGGNRQYITLGNLAENPRAFIFLMDYAKRRRIKMWGSARIVESDEALLSSLTADGDAAASTGRAIAFELEAWDRNCAQHIPRLLAFEDVAAAIGHLERRIADLEAENTRLRAGG